MLRIDQLRLLPDESEDVLLHKCARLLRVAPSALTGLTVLRRAIDARESLTFVYTVAVSAPQEAALLELWQDWTRREAGLRQEFMAMLRELDARRGDLFSYAVSDLGRNADTVFSPQCLLDSLFQSRTERAGRSRRHPGLLSCAAWPLSLIHI